MYTVDTFNRISIKLNKKKLYKKITVDFDNKSLLINNYLVLHVQ